ncbi:uncharacterized protein LAESUDRAFT_715015 [Laetiporus sulphureus 93-53]|uniref:XPG-I domain-containing protein n=1 Tax=Laetiporus sulphureus 93-53 TaxID=1314785 RepID=A0A165DMM7_9APHY|nr:uncharacterized protein LAESUDRAFT_715015 [Laetiporus sulphureus 93-53]KZT05209.1 hypothetical protein LAESUDRAFT_715015 [Laetiporus sulphureus 93-53]
MGVPGLWNILRPAGETRSLTHLAVVDGFEANPDGVRGFRVGIDASIWFFHASYGREGENPELRTLFFKCMRLMSAPFLPLFVFDGPKRPKIKRGKRVSGKHHWMVQGMQAIIHAFGFEWRMAPGEAEAELAYLNRIGVIDAVYTDDVDTFLFGAKMIVRNPSLTLTGNHAHSLKNADGRNDGNHVAIYKADKILEHPAVQLTQGGLILIGILRGGDYQQEGLPGCGPTIAHGLAKCGFGDTLLQAARTLPREDLPAFLKIWRDDVRAELRTNSRGILGKKHIALANRMPTDFPPVDVLLSYTHPITSEEKGMGHRNTVIDWEKEPDLGKIAALCEMYFEWGVKEIIIKRFRTVLWPAAVLRILRRSVLLQDKKVARSTWRAAIGVPSTPRKSGKARKVSGTPSSMIAKHFSYLELGSPMKGGGRDSDAEDDEDEEPLIVKIRSSRQHASTDGVLEYRLEIAPTQLARLCEAGVKGLRTALDTGLSASDGDDEHEGDQKGKGKKKLPPDPQSHLRIWLPACMVRIVEPELVDEFEGIQEMRSAKKAGKGTGTARGTNSQFKAAVTEPSPSRGKGKKKSKMVEPIREEQEESSDGYTSPTPQKPSAAARNTKKTTDSAARQPAADAPSGSSRNLKGLFPATKGTIIEKNTTRATLKTAASKGHHSSPRVPREVPFAKRLPINDVSSDDELSANALPTFPSRLPALMANYGPSSSSHSSAAVSFILAALDSYNPTGSTPSSSSKRHFTPAPFPLSFEDSPSATDDPFQSQPAGRPHAPTPPQKAQERSISSSDLEFEDSPLKKSPRKSQKHGSPRKQASGSRAFIYITSEDDAFERSGSPSPLGRQKGTLGLPRRAQWNAKYVNAKADVSVIEISSDSDNAQTVSKIAPLTLARAKSSSRPKYRDLDPDSVIDLT